MDALKLIAQDSLKAEVPSFEVGDSVRVHVKIKEGDRERIQVFEGTVIAKNTAVLPRPLPFAAFPTAAVWREFSRCILRTWTRWRLSVRVVSPCETVLPQRQSGQGCKGQIQNQIVLIKPKPALISVGFLYGKNSPNFTNYSVFTSISPWKKKSTCVIINLYFVKG